MTDPGAFIGYSLLCAGLLVNFWKIYQLDRNYTKETAVFNHKLELIWKQFIKDHGLNGDR
jgi:hypothetical protein